MGAELPLVERLWERRSHALPQQDTTSNSYFNSNSRQDSENQYLIIIHRVQYINNNDLANHGKKIGQKITHIILYISKQYTGIYIFEKMLK